MQELLEKLEQWLRLNKPEYLSRLQCGLTLKEIEDLATPLSLRLPEEIVQLYQWRNGSEASGDNFFLIYRFLPLREAIEDTLHLRKDAEAYPLFESNDRKMGFPNYYDWQYHWFSIFYEVKDRIAMVIGDNPSAYAPIIITCGENSWTELWFKSLKGFISAILECYETELYLLEDFCLDDAEEIWAKYRDLV
ncbi:SMI1/KNR4 family protein [Tumidithrix elongata RA019]|uniref:SMI1/KNR4 family protein n=1 Tax=Tumidithrix elongata BACA0141 TaxID=2716417 RepID=A0AAW9PQI1_9CYAN|nr:SMI1/KNR4 family protein [Tumidithrix elongata RA019]